MHVVGCVCTWLDVYARGISGQNSFKGDMKPRENLII